MARKQLLDQVKAGELSVAQVLARGKDDPLVARTKIRALIQTVPGWGDLVGETHDAAWVGRSAVVTGGSRGIGAAVCQALAADGRRVGGLGAQQHQAPPRALS